MVEKITKLNCMACGGKLLIDRKKSMVVCPYCGNEYYVPDLLAEFVLCPICESLDRVEKVADLEDTTFSFDRLFEWDEDAFNWEEDAWDPDDHSGESSRPRLIWIIVSAVILVFFVQRVVLRFTDSAFKYFVPLALVFVIGIWLILYAKNNMAVGQGQEDSKASIRQTLLELQEMEYRRLQPLYDQLFYCHRDGVVFLPGEEDSAQPEDMRAYLRQHV